MSYEIGNDKLLREAYEAGRRAALNEQGKLPDLSNPPGTVPGPMELPDDLQGIPPGGFGDEGQSDSGWKPTPWPDEWNPDPDPGWLPGSGPQGTTKGKPVPKWLEDRFRKRYGTDMDGYPNGTIGSPPWGVWQNGRLYLLT